MQTNKNYTHICDTSLEKLEDNVLDLSKVGYSDDEIKKIIEFYLLNAPIAKSVETKKFGLKDLKEYGWCGKSDMNQLEKLLLSKSKLQIFCFMRSDTISDTLKQMLLNDNICSTHPRAVLKQNFKVKVLESGKVEIDSLESRMECLFRHIRNAIAHNRIYCFSNNNILLEDSDGSKLSARILIHKKTLIDWIDVICNKQSKSKNDETKIDDITENLSNTIKIDKTA